MSIILQISNQLASLLSNPGRVGVGRASCQMDAAGSQFDEEKQIDGFEPDGFDSGEIASQDLVFVMPQEPDDRSEAGVRRCRFRILRTEEAL